MELRPEAEVALEELRSAKQYLEQDPSVGDALAEAAKRKRAADGVSPSMRTGGVSILLGCAAALIYGVIGVIKGDSLAPLLIVGAAVLFLLALFTHTLPTKKNSPRLAQEAWDDAVYASRKYILQRESFPVPAQYAHSIVLERMIRIINEGRARTAEDAYIQLKDDLMALNSSVSVSQKEYDEVVTIKPLFLICDYRDEI